jgi:hypothetical protein
METIEYSSLILLCGDVPAEDLDNAIEVGNQYSGLLCFP